MERTEWYDAAQLDGPQDPKELYRRCLEDIARLCLFKETLSSVREAVLSLPDQQHERYLPVLDKAGRSADAYAGMLEVLQQTVKKRYPQLVRRMLH
jgi:hypothetical protein